MGTAPAPSQGRPCPPERGTASAPENKSGCRYDTRGDARGIERGRCLGELGPREPI